MKNGAPGMSPCQVAYPNAMNRKDLCLQKSAMVLVVLHAPTHTVPARGRNHNNAWNLAKAAPFSHTAQSRASGV
jgi:hypothetical protein